MNSPVVERGLLGTTRHPFHLYGSKEISGIADKMPNIITKDAPIALGSNKQMPKVWEMFFI